MKDAHLAGRATVCLIALLVALAVPATAQTRTPAEVDRAVDQQQATIDRLESKVDELIKANDALKKDLADTKSKTAPPEAWNALRVVGLTFVCLWALVTLVRDWPRRRKEASDEAR